MLSSTDELTKQRMMQARALSKEAKGGGLNLGKKISVPQDVMIEELNLQSNRGSLMFQERQKRAERFTLENSSAQYTDDVHVESDHTPQTIPEPRKEHKTFSIPVTKKVTSVTVASGGLNLGKKISIPQDVMMEELHLTSNRGSRMFQERLKRVEMFTLDNSGVNYSGDVNLEVIPPPQITPGSQGGKENQNLIPIPGKHSLIMNLQKTVAKTGSPDVIAPGYTGPLKGHPHEKFNTTVIPRSYCSPWAQALGDNEELLNTLNAQLPQLPQRPANYRCFNRSPMPFGGIMASKRVIPVINFEAMESQKLPVLAQDSVCQRPDFNRAPRGWGADYTPESNEL